MVAVKSKSWHFIREDFLSTNVSRLKCRRLKESQIEIRENEKTEKLPIQNQHAEPKEYLLRVYRVLKQIRVVKVNPLLGP